MNDEHPNDEHPNDEHTVRADDGCRLWATETGTGTPLILCHGGPGLWDMFGDLAAALAAHRRVIRWDQRGCGRSEHRGPYSVDRTAGDLDAVRAHFGLDRTAVLGHSWGATLALRYAVDHPYRVSALGYVSGTGLGHDWHPYYKSNLAARVPRLADLKNRADTDDRELAILQWSADFADPDRATGYAGRMADPWFGINHACNATIGAELRGYPVSEAACRDLTVPTLIVDGAEDIRPRWAVDSLQDALPSVTRVTLPDVGHVPWLEAPDEFAAAVLAHL